MMKPAYIVERENFSKKLKIFYGIHFGFASY